MIRILLFFCLAATLSAFIVMAIHPGWQLFMVSLVALAWAIPGSCLWFRKDASRERFHMGLGIGILLSLLACFWYMSVASDQIPGFVFALKTVPCGMSSCSRQVNQNSVPYNPNSYFPDQYGNVNPASIAIVLCPCQECRWADLNGQLPRGYSGSYINGVLVLNLSDPIPGGYATSSPSDWPDPGTGGMDGYYKDISKVVDIVSCPGVSPTPNPAGIRGRGNPLCATCLQYWRNIYAYVDLYSDTACPASLYQGSPDYMCPFCPGPTTCAYVAWFVYSYLMLSLVLAVVWCVSRVSHT